jgi:hypothetical protein
MFVYAENTFLQSAIVNTEPGLLRCEVNEAGDVTSCTDHKIAYRLYQNWDTRGDRALYVYEDADNPSPENRGVIECSRRFPLSNCQQRELTTNLEAGPGEHVMFIAEPLLEKHKDKDEDSSGFFSSGSDEPKQVNPESGSNKTYPARTGAMQCRVTDEGLLKDCKTLDIEYESQKSSEEEA